MLNHNPNTNNNNIMPKVGDKSYPYTPKGKKAAKKAAKRKGLKIMSKKKKGKGT
jgi:hypothetical protein